MSQAPGEQHADEPPVDQCDVPYPQDVRHVAYHHARDYADHSDAAGRRRFIAVARKPPALSQGGAEDEQHLGHEERAHTRQHPLVQQALPGYGSGYEGLPVDEDEEYDYEDDDEYDDYDDDEAFDDEIDGSEDGNVQDAQVGSQQYIAPIAGS